MITSQFNTAVVDVNCLVVAINLNHNKDPGVKNRCEPTPLLTKSSMTNFKFKLRFT